MPRKCSICQHPRRPEIDRLLVAGSALRDVAARFGLSKSAVFRHKQKDLPEKLLKAERVREVAEAGSLLEEIQGLIRKSKGVLAEAEEAGELKVALAAIRETRSSMEMLGKLTGELKPPPAEQKWQPAFVLPEGTRVSIYAGEPSTPTPSPAKEEPPLLPPAGPEQ